MRGSAWIVMLCAWLAVPALGAEPSFPYTADVSVDEVEVRCGPGWDYYATQHLRRGTKVDVYRHEPGGWLAIRPPEGSFSWIPARQVKRGADPRVGEVAIDGAVAWVGSAVADVAQHKWQVRLEQGELVEILGEKPLSVGPGFATETYLQIAPAAGEFRWIHAENAFAPGAVAHRSATKTIELTNYAGGAGRAAAPGSDKSAAADRIGPSPIAGRGSVTHGTTAAKDEKELAQLARQVEQLKVDLSLLVTRQIDQWDLDALRARRCTRGGYQPNAARAGRASDLVSHQRIRSFAKTFPTPLRAGSHASRSASGKTWRVARPGRAAHKLAAGYRGGVDWRYSGRIRRRSRRHVRSPPQFRRGRMAHARPLDAPSGSPLRPVGR